MIRLITGMAVALAFFQLLEPRPVQAAEPIQIVLGTATPGGGFELYGTVLAEAVNLVDPGLKVTTRGTAGSEENLVLLESGALDVAYSLVKAIHQAQPQMAQRLEQAKDTLPRNTFNAASDPNHIHPGVRRYLGELGLR